MVVQIKFEAARINANEYFEKQVFSTCKRIHGPSPSEQKPFVTLQVTEEYCDLVTREGYIYENLDGKIRSIVLQQRRCHNGWESTCWESSIIKL